MGLIAELHKQHGEIKQLLKDIETTDNMEIIDSSFGELKKVLISHLINEDNYLYPLLRDLEETRQITASYENEMNKISTEIMEFYNNYQNGKKEVDFKGNVEDIVYKLVYRISKEERELYPIFKEKYPNR